jgi:D-3-phosphoglycerate dehydrogenase
MAKVLVATEKPFAKEAVDGIRKIVEGAGFELALLEKYTEKADLLKAVADVDAIIVRSDKVSADVVEASKNLRIVVRAGAGYDNLDLAACTAKGVVAMNTPGQNSNAVAELAIGMMIFMARNQFNPGTGREIKGKKLGIHAYGNVGKLVASHAKGFGMEIYAFDPFVKKEEIEKDGVKVLNSAEELYAVSDYLSLHIPANDKTKKSIGFSILSKMPKGACLVNTARKEVIDEDGLAKVLEDRPDLKYVSDIAPDNHHFLVEKFGTRVFATPKKMGAETAEANINAGLAAATQIVNFIKNGDRTFQVNK